MHRETGIGAKGRGIKPQSPRPDMPIFYYWYCKLCGHRNSIERGFCIFCGKSREREE